MAVERLASRRWPQLKGADDERFVRSGAARLLTGGMASGRMDVLVAQVRWAVDEGVAAQDMLVVCADPSSASRLRGKLATSGMDGVRVVTSRELACDIAGREQACAATGVGAGSGRVRILSAYETDFVVEDLKTLGARPKRLRELLKFLYRGWTELLDEDPEWLFTVEEIDTFEFLAEELAYLGAVMEPQISNLATKVLRLDPDLRAGVERRRLFVLDYQNLSRASQLLCQLVAGECLVAVADGQACAEVHESYPYLPGVADFVRFNPSACVEVLPDGDLAEPERSERVWPTPGDELEGVADAIAAVIKDGADPSSIGVMAQHLWWSQNMGRALKERGVPVNVWYGPMRLRGDIRDLDRSLALRTVTLLRLLADPHDAVAWRSWFGFGDYLTRGNLFTEMRKTRVATEYPADVRRDLEAFGYDLGYDLDPLLHEARNLRGPELLACLVRTLAGEGEPVPAVLRPLLALGLNADAAQMVAELDRRQFFAGIPEREGVVVSAYDSMAGLDFARLYAVGFVNGLFPGADYFDLTRVSVNKQEKMREQDMRTARAMARLGREGLCVSRFDHADHGFAERCGLKQVRIFAADDNGAQLSEVEPSIYTDVLLGRA